VGKGRHGENKKLGLWHPGLLDCQTRGGLARGQNQRGGLAQGKGEDPWGITGSQSGPKRSQQKRESPLSPWVVYIANGWDDILAPSPLWVHILHSSPKTRIGGTS
jgi:hypothetical protein